MTTIPKHKSENNDGCTLRYRKTQLLRAEDGQLSLSVQLELEEDNIPL